MPEEGDYEDDDCGEVGEFEKFVAEITGCSDLAC